MIKTIFFSTLSLSFLFFCDLVAQHAQSDPNQEVIQVGSRRELFLDDFLIEKITGEVQKTLHQPDLKEVVIEHNEPWEGNTCGYHSIFKDGDIFRMYYRGSQISLTKDKYIDAHPFYICYAESDDGIHWEKPNLGLFEFNGSKNNNIILASGTIGHLQLNLSDNASMFKDANLNASPDAQYKALVCSEEPKGLFAFKSEDGIHWFPMSNKPVITEGAFDSQNIAFWDSINNEYRAYWRYFKPGTSETILTNGSVRAVRTAVSKDFINWSEFNDVAYNDSLDIELYTNQVKPYDRAPHIFIGVPTRYIEKGWSPSMRVLPQLAHRELRSSHSLRFGTALTDAMLMSSRDGSNFFRWNESFVRPGIERDGTWNYGHLYFGWGIVETQSALKGAPNELSFYATENSWTAEAPTSDLRRYTLRLDGFVSLRASMYGGEVVTRPIRFQGDKLYVNFASSVAGEIRVEIQDFNGRAIEGFTALDCYPIYGDNVNRTVAWKNGGNLRSLESQNIKLKFILKDADLFSFQFGD